MLCCAWGFPAFRVRLEANSTSFIRLYPRGDAFVKLQGLVAALFTTFLNASIRIIYESKRTVIDTKNKRSYNECKSPGQKRKGAILMDYKRKILEMLEQINEPCILEKIYWYVQRLLLRK